MMSRRSGTTGKIIIRTETVEKDEGFSFLTVCELRADNSALNFNCL